MEAGKKKGIKALLEKGVQDGVCPGAVLLAAQGGEINFFQEVGHRTLLPHKAPTKKDTIFDLASLTKPLATTLAIMKLVDEKEILLDQNFPNPFNPQTTVRYGLPEAESVSLVVYNARGEEVVRLEDESQKEAGFHTAIWNGVDRAGRPAASGLYLAVLSAGSVSHSVKMILVK